MSERQMHVNLSSIRSDHLERYEYARDICGGHILDAACGAGYGSFIMSSQSRIETIDAVDISKDAIDLANKSWTNPKTTFHQVSVLDFQFKKTYDWLVSFETIEHVPNVEEFLKEASKHCKKILCSVPNESVIPFDVKRYPFHLKHYKPNEIKDLLEDCGFDIHTIKYQRDRYKEGLNSRTGRTIILEGTSKNI